MKGSNSPKVVRPVVSPMNTQLNHTVQIGNQEHQSHLFMRGGIQQKQDLEQPSVTIERANQISRQQLNQQHFQRTIDSAMNQVSQQKTPILQYQGRQVALDQMNESDKQEAKSLSDGKVYSIAEYREMLIKQEQQKLNMMPDISVKKTRPSLPTPVRSRTKTPNVSQTRSRPKAPLKTQDQKPQETFSEATEQPRFQHQGSSTPRYIDNAQMHQTRRVTQPAQPPAMQPQIRPTNAQVQQQPKTMMQNPSSPQIPTTQTSQPQQTSPQQTSFTQQPRQNNHNYLIQPPKHSVNKQIVQCPLPSCIPSSQIKKIIESTPVSEEYSDSIRMLVMLANGEQRLITFTLPNQACTIQEILEQVGVPLQPDTPIEVSEANSNGINYMVTVGFLQSACQTEEMSTETVDSHQAMSATEYQDNLPLKEPSPVREHSPEPVKEVEQPKYIEGKMAVCGYCGILSDDFNKCMRCKTKLPENVKAILAISSSKKGEDKGSSQKKPELINMMNTNGTKDLNVPKKKVTRSKNSENEPVILTLSSDEEDDISDQNTGLVNDNMLMKLGTAITLSPIIKKEPSMSDIQRTSANIDGDTSNLYPENAKVVSLQCRTARIGSYRTIPKENISISYSNVAIKVANVSNPKEVATIRIERNDIVKVLICFQKQLPVLFYYLRPNTGSSIREVLEMKENNVNNYYEPLSDNESHRRITLLPENITEEVKKVLQSLYQPSMLEELTLKEANDILVKTCPKELTLANLHTSSGSIFEVKPLFTYPPEGRGRISINTEDYMCLGSDQFLNDVIIDFYLKFLVHNLTLEEQERIHVFSTFFYKRLTTKPVKASRKSQPSELDPNLTPAEKRHARVKTWTKNIDLFKKDYVIVPINENCHWFLAIICFPGLEGCQTMDGHSVKIDITPKKKKESPTKTTIGNVTITPVKKEDIPCEELESDKDEAEGDESELESDDSDETQTVTSHATRPPIKQPCILIFDSLAGSGRSRVVATIRDYLTCEYKTKYNKEKIFNKDVIKGACPKVPQQTNFTDCGLYLLQYVEHFFMEPIKDYYIPINSLKNWFDEITVTRKREDISILIKTLMLEYNKDVDLLPEIMFPTKNGLVVDQFGDDEEMEEEMSEGEDFNSPPVCSETDMDSSMASQEEDPTKLQNSLLKPSCESVSDKTDIVEQTVSNAELLKPDVSELSIPKPQSSRDTLSYLKAKRIIRHKNLDNPCKKLKNSE
ncbi:hypothetical protein WA026_006617 [Henosepilachna vigintioctopunctata]|uniref:Ubiquitin-like protease family profile domain-containing protein n=1 Tax=Henosepilachna vigintioctopunctata TaxID=420089 RepID=A0AAW1UG67_9CUCU